ncbi:MAG: DUF924 family protein [Venatoribacter sp.]
MQENTINDVLNFWFKELQPQQWFAKDEQLDLLIKQRFGSLLQAAASGELYQWRKTAQGRLAEIIVLDQFSRNIYRDQAAAFAQDGIALVLAQEAVAQGALEQLNTEERTFLLMPYMHSESTLIHELAVPLFKQYARENSYVFELKHKEIVDRFGRYPHRNALLGRTSNAEEIQFLQQPGSAF